ncbi:MAG: thioredoxin-disulfide reductase [Myxococcales bacterium]|nr:thioredoxin-disulfide reductase [Myxococcales bacterium]
MENVVILGSGPAGLTAAIYAARANLNPIVVEGFGGDHQPGGQLMITTEVENYPGFVHGVTGPKLMETFRGQAERFGTRFHTEDAVKVELHGPVKRVWLESDPSTAIETRTVIIATGAVAKWIGCPGEKELQNYGVSACATCDGAFFRERDVIVVGGGDTALEEANYLANMCRSVTLVHRRDTLRASKIMQDRALKNPKIKFAWNRVIEEINDVAAKKVTGVVLRDTITQARHEMPIDGVFVAIGHTPASALFMGQVDTHDNGYIRVEHGSTYTNVPGVFACGDVADHVYRQAITAAGTGCMAAIDAERWIGAQEG